MSERGEGPNEGGPGPRDALLFITTGLAEAWKRILLRAEELAEDGGPSKSGDSRENTDGKQGVNRPVNRAVNTRKH
jgi:hypothetical protein